MKVPAFRLPYSPSRVDELQEGIAKVLLSGTLSPRAPYSAAVRAGVG